MNEAERSDGARMRAILLVAAAAAFVLSAFLSPGFSGYPSDAFPVPQVRPPIQPAGFAFAIWGVIYLWLLVHAATGLFVRADAPAWDAVRWPLIGSLTLGAGWLTAAARSPVFATVLIWVMLALALLALARSPAASDRWRLRAPIALYAGWLTAASFVSVGLLIGGYGIAGSNTAAALVTLPVAALFAVLVQRRIGHAPTYAAGAGWGLFGIAVANLTSAPMVAAVSVAGLAALVATAAGAMRRA